MTKVSSVGTHENLQPAQSLGIEGVSVCFECFSPLLPQIDFFLGLFILWGPLQIHCEILDSPCNIASQCPSQPTSLVRYPIVREQIHDLFTGMHNFRSRVPKAAEPAEPIQGVDGYFCVWLKTLNFRQGLKSGGDFALFCELLCLFKQRLVYGRMHRQISTGFVIRNIAQQPLPLVLRQVAIRNLAGQLY